MKQLITALSMAIAATGSFAADTSMPAASKPLTAAQQKSADCASANKGKTGDDYKSGVKACMREANNPLLSEEKKSACAKTSKGLKGDAYKAAFKECLAASSPA